MHQNRIQRRIRATIFTLSLVSLLGAALAEDSSKTAQPNAMAPVLASNQYQQTNLVSNLPGKAAVTDPNLVNAWGLSRSSTSPWWVSDNGMGVATLYGAAGNIVPLVVKIPPSDPNVSSAGTPTGTVFNGSTEFEIVTGLPAVFMFVSEDGVISGWNPKVKPTDAVILVNQKSKSVFKGMTIATINGAVRGTHNYLYVADFRQGRVEIFDSHFQRTMVLENNFAQNIPAGFAPFNVQNIGGNIYVTYAKQDAQKHDEVPGAGIGFVNVYSPTGQLLMKLERGSWFNAPWGITQAPTDFGPFSHNILVGNFGSGQIAAFDPVTGKFQDFLRDAKSTPIFIDGLWALSFGSDALATGGPATTLFFSAGPDAEANGLFGSLTALKNPQGSAQ
jgi:uncharacterized protein (TIGR03118 family)